MTEPLRPNATGTAVYCTVDQEIARNGIMSIRQVQSRPPWFDVWCMDHTHVMGTLDLAAAWEIMMRGY